MATRSFVLTYTYGPNMLERRQPHREEHLAHVRKAHADGLIVMAGAYSDPVDGAVLLFEAEDAGQVYGWVAQDPYARAGLVFAASVREWSPAVGGRQG